MSFYLSPPTGTVPVHRLEEYATKRLQFLLRLVACHNKREVESVLEDAAVVDQSDCLITNTAKDEISHHILRLTLGGDQESKSFFCDAELALFKLRLENMVVDEWTLFFKSVEKFLRKFEGCVFGVRLAVLSDLRLVFEILKGTFESWHQLSTDICGQTAFMSVSLPFQLVFRLVAGRQVDVVKGIAVVPIAHLKDVFIELFERLMVTATHQASMEREWAMRDERIRRLATTLKGLLRAETKTPGYQPGHFPALRLADLWQHSVMFPPCMANVVKVLQDEHTLKHHDRVQLTLFLKELGLPVNDALLLWKREYSVPTKSNKSKSCQHHWQGNERRYIYNIRHLYGLEGSRTNYRAHSCSSIQDRALTCGDAGGCPFVSHDTAALKLSLLDQDIREDNVDHILKLCHRKMYGHACQNFMLHKLKQAGQIQSDLIVDERHTKMEVPHSHSKYICGSNIKTSQEKVQQNGITRKKLACAARSSAYTCEKISPYGLANNFAVKSEEICGEQMSPYRLANNFAVKLEKTCGEQRLPYGLENNFAVKSEKSCDEQMSPYGLANNSAVKSEETCGAGLSLKENFADNNFNLQNEKTLLRLSLLPSNDQSIPNHLVSRSNLIKGVNLNGESSMVKIKSRAVTYGRKRYLFKMARKNQIEWLSQKEMCSNTSSCDRRMAAIESCLRANNSGQFANDKPNKLASQQQEMNSDTETLILQSKLLLAPHGYETHHSRFSYCNKQDEMISLIKKKQDRFSSDDYEDCDIKADNGVSVSALVGGVSVSALVEGVSVSALVGAESGLAVADEWLLDGKQLLDPSQGKKLSYPAKRKWLLDSGEGKQLPDITESKWLSGITECKWLSDTAEVKWLLDPNKVEQLSCVKTLQLACETRCTSEYNSLPILGNPQPTLDPLSEGTLAGLTELKTGTRFSCDRSQNGELSHLTKDIIERQRGSLQQHSLTEGAVSIKKPRDIYWFSRRLLLVNPML